MQAQTFEFRPGDSEHLPSHINSRHGTPLSDELIVFSGRAFPGPKPGNAVEAAKRVEVFSNKELQAQLLEAISDNE
jgi:hypothetical protein